MEILKGDCSFGSLGLISTPASQWVIDHSFMNLLLKNLKKLLNFEAQSIALIKEEIRPVKDDLEFIRSIFGNVEQELYKDICTRVLQCDIWDKDVISSNFVRDTSLLYFINSLQCFRKDLSKKRSSIYLRNSQE